jgi:hypothetical protein
MLQRKGGLDLPAPEIIENEVKCMRLAQSIFEDFSNVPEDHPKYTFPFLHYLTSATIIALGLIIKQGSFKHTYGKLTLEAARSLKKHCRKTWVSGRMARALWKLNQMAEAIMNSSSRLPENLGNSTQQKLSSRATQKSHEDIYHEAPKTCHHLLEQRPDFAPSCASCNETDSSLSNFSRPIQLRQAIHRDPSIMSHLQLDQRHLAANEADFEERHTRTPISSQHISRNLRHDESDRGAEGNIQCEAHMLGIQPCSPGDAAPNLWDVPSSFSLPPGRNVAVSDPNAWLPGEMIDGGIEWLQTLFASDQDTEIPSPWDL